MCISSYSEIEQTNVVEFMVNLWYRSPSDQYGLFLWPSGCDGKYLVFCILLITLIIVCRLWYLWRSTLWQLWWIVDSCAPRLAHEEAPKSIALTWLIYLIQIIVILYSWTDIMNKCYIHQDDIMRKNIFKDNEKGYCYDRVLIL